MLKYHCLQNISSRPVTPDVCVCGAVMSVTVLLMSLLVERLWVVLPKSPYFASVYSLALTFGIMMFGGIIAFFMVRRLCTVSTTTAPCSVNCTYICWW